MAILNQKSADTLCTIIACGFISRETGRKGKKTTFIYEQGSNADERSALTEKLGHYKVPLTLKEQAPKPIRPFILAQTGYTSEAVEQGLMDDLSHQVQRAEAEINRLYSETTPLPGAYIGGMCTSSSVHFCGGSDLYPYNPQYRQNAEGSDPSNNKIVQSYNRAKTISNILEEYLTNKRGGTGRIKWEIDKIDKIEASCACNQVFASVHGMTRSMINYLPNIDKQKVCLELALGRDTCKVASCIPCSIFMSANGTPATATHLGRGDNWNFPQSSPAIPSCSAADLPTIPPTSIDSLLKNWCLEVNSCYDTGLALLAANPKVQSWKTEYMGNTAWHNHIPQLFLEALTFENPFIKKICDTL